MRPVDPPQNINPKELAPASGFSHATVAGDMVWLGGQIGSDATGKVDAPGDIVAQFSRAIGNVAIALRAAGSTPADTVKLTYYVTDVKAYKANLNAIGSAYREVFDRHFPATTLVEVRSLFDPDALVEIEAVAIRRP
jgi:enamine deaminase RidA (YjgF/YER057c/UK114 family)